jgi:hypothetical protein
MRWSDEARSSDVENRRGESPSGFGMQPQPESLRKSMEISSAKP